MDLKFFAEYDSSTWAILPALMFAYDRGFCGEIYWTVIATWGPLSAGVSNTD